jgi:phosphopantothenoylcysteine decarboxylase/phosphopantothenate--cysteine ligase
MKDLKNLKNKKILVTAGPTWVPIDKVRVITNIFSGRLGLLIAKEAAKKGAKVTLLMGPGPFSFFENKNKNLRILHFKYFDELYNLMKREISSKKYDIVIHSAAVSDYTPTSPYKGKIKSGKENLMIKLKPTIKIVDQIKKWNKKVFLVKFKLEVNVKEKELIERAYESMLASDADLIVANDLKHMKGENQKAFIIDKEKKIILCQNKKEIAKKLLNIIIVNYGKKY